METLGDVFCAQARANGAFFHDGHRRGQRAGANQQGNIIGFLLAHRARNLELVTEFAADHRRSNHFALALLNQHHGQTLADVLARK